MCSLNAHDKIGQNIRAVCTNMVVTEMHCKCEALSASCLLSRPLSLSLSTRWGSLFELCHTFFDSLMVSIFERSENVAIARRLLVRTMQQLLACSDGCGLLLWFWSSICLHLRMRIQLTAQTQSINQSTRQQHHEGTSEHRGEVLSWGEDTA